MTEQLKFKVKCESVLNAYSGAVGCMCGCLGDYAYPSSKVEEGGKQRGYEVGPEEVNDRKVRTRVNKLNRLIESGDYDELDANSAYVFVRRGERVLAVYF